MCDKDHSRRELADQSADTCARCGRLACCYTERNGAAFACIEQEFSAVQPHYPASFRFDLSPARLRQRRRGCYLCPLVFRCGVVPCPRRRPSIQATISSARQPTELADNWIRFGKSPASSRRQTLLR